ncbi:MAG: GNAT family N-acetyltransferase [Caldilineaceae bacterium]|nr:GNAT family N-acetyltransferase [Caldilineaceae bacterium]
MGRRSRYAGEIDKTRPWFKTRDGLTLRSRLIRPDDAPLLLDLFAHLSTETRRRRFHIDVDRVDERTKQQRAVELADVDNRTQGGAVLALTTSEDGSEHIVGVARLARPVGEPDHPEAEAAITVRDDFQRRGVGAELLRRMVLLAKRMQVRTIIAAIEADNHAALRLFRGLALPTEASTHHAETTMRIDVPVA